MIKTLSALKDILEQNTILECNAIQLSQCYLLKLKMARPTLLLEKNNYCMKHCVDNFDLPKGTESLVLLVTASYNIDRKPTGSKFWHINY